MIYESLFTHSRQRSSSTDNRRILLVLVIVGVWFILIISSYWKTPSSSSQLPFHSSSLTASVIALWGGSIVENSQTTWMKTRTSSSRTTIPNPKQSTIAFFPGRLHQYGDYRDQMMALTYFVIQAIELNISQMLLPSMKLYAMGPTSSSTGSRQDPYFVSLDELFDVDHFNSYSSTIMINTNSSSMISNISMIHAVKSTTNNTILLSQFPRWVTYDRKQHYQWQFNTTHSYWMIEHPLQNATHPIAYGENQASLYGGYKWMSTLPWQKEMKHKIMYQGLLRPQQEIRTLVQQILLQQQQQPSTTNLSSTKKNLTNNIHSVSRKMITPCTIAIHACIEPDMQRHVTCRDKYEGNLTRIFQSLENVLPILVCSRIFISVNFDKLYQPDTIHDPITMDNIQTLEHAVQYGLWGGQVEVMLGGIPFVNQTRIGQQWPGITASIVDFELCVNADIFIGSEVSSFSNDIWGTRFYRNVSRNYKYLPGGRIEPAIRDHAVEPPTMDC